jgi:hypothetical protein
MWNISMGWVAVWAIKGENCSCHACYRPWACSTEVLQAQLYNISKAYSVWFTRCLCRGQPLPSLLKGVVTALWIKKPNECVKFSGKKYDNMLSW